MKLALLTALGVGTIGVLVLAFRCWLGWHGAVILRQKRGPDGKVVRPHVLQWECGLCHRPVSETALVTNWRQQAELRRAARLRRVS